MLIMAGYGRHRRQWVNMFTTNVVEKCYKNIARIYLGFLVMYSIAVTLNALLKTFKFILLLFSIGTCNLFVDWY